MVRWRAYLHAGHSRTPNNDDILFVIVLAVLYSGGVWGWRVGVLRVVLAPIVTSVGLMIVMRHTLRSERARIVAPCAAVGQWLSRQWWRRCTRHGWV